MDRATYIVLESLRSRSVEMFWTIIFFLLLCATYVYALAPRYTYAGISANPNTLKFVEAMVVIATFALLLPRVRLEPSSWVLRFLLILTIVPLACVYSMKNASRSFFVIVMAGFAITSLVVGILPRIRLKRIVLSKLVLSTLIVCAACVYLLLFLFNGLPSLRAVNLTRVYEVRETYSVGWGGLDYLLKWQGKIINAVFFWIAFYRRSRPLMVFAVLLQVALFLWTGHKVYLFMFALYGVMILVVRHRLKFSMLSRAAIGVVLLALVPLWMSGEILPASVLVRRAFVVPAINSYYYYDFFSGAPKVQLANSSVTLGLVENDYAHYKNIPSMIGSVYRDEGSNPNVGYLADGYMHFGVFGVICFSFLLGLLLVFTDSIVRRNQSAFTIVVATIPFLSMVNSSFFTTLLTHGVFLSWFIVYFYRRSATMAEEGRPPVAT